MSRGCFYTYDHFEQTDWNNDTCDIIGNKKEGMGFVLMNHWRNSDDLDLPSESNAEEFNMFDALRNRFEQCKVGGRMWLRLTFGMWVMCSRL